MAKPRFKTKLTKKQKRNNVLVFLAVFASLYAVTLLFSHFVIGVFEGWTFGEIFLLGLFMTFFVCSMLLVPVPLAGAALGAQKGRAKRVRDDSTFAPVQNIEYYRESLSQLNPSLVSLLIDLDIYGEKDIAATLLRMQNKKAVSFCEKGGIAATAESATNRLDDSEIELLGLIKNGKLNEKQALSQWKQNRFREAERLGYIRRKDAALKSKAVGKYVGLGLLSVAVSFCLWGAFLSLEFYNEVYSAFGFAKCFAFLLLIDVFMFAPFYLFGLVAAYHKRGDVIWERTPLGNETAEKVAGLARFIHEYSMLSQAKKEQVILWEDYLVYALVLEENEQIVKDISRLCEVNLHRLDKLHLLGG